MNDLTSQIRSSNAYPFPGGIAGKLGDRFEAKWAVKKLLEVLLGLADALQFEFVDPVNHGVEFWLSRDGNKEWYQAKRQNTQGNWTIGRLAKEGVLTTAILRLSAVPDDHFYFLSTAPATEIHHLSQRAILIDSDVDVFLNSVTNEDRASNLPELNRHWDTSTDQTWHYLKRFHILCEPETDLDINIKMVGGQLFNDSFDRYFPLLRDYLENNFNRELTTEIVHKEIIEAGVLSPRAAFDPTLRERITSANQRYLDSYAPFGVGGESVERKEAQEVLSLLISENGPAIILLTGNAGTGKSGVIRQILTGLKAQGVAHLAFRVDSRLDIGSSEALGQALLGRDENPIYILQSLTADGKAILFIDQIDAISEVSGRAGAIREVIFELLSFARFSLNICIVAACRSYDLSNDSALLQLEKEQRVTRVEIKTFDWDSEVAPLLQVKGIPAERLTKNQQDLLKLPLNLALFLEIVGTEEQTFEFQSTTELFDHLIEKKQRIIRQRGISSFALMPVLSHLAEIMSRDQSLDVPESVLDRFPNALDLLATEYLISQVDGRINFFHESLFDYAFARGFVTDRRNVIDLLKEDEQHLFRRTQVRQILTMYRQAGPQHHYLKQLRDLLNSPNVRYHLKDAVARWLGGLAEPTEAELAVALALDAPHQEMPPLVRLAIYPQPGWLPILIGRGLISAWLRSGSEDRRGDALNILRNAVKAFPGEVAELLRNWWGNDPARGGSLLGWFSWLHDMQPCPDLLDLNLDLIRSKPDGLFDRSGLYDRYSTSAWLKHDPAAAGKLLQAWFETWYENFAEGHPFGRDQHNDMDFHWLRELKEKSPAIFLEAAIPAFLEAISRIDLTFDGHCWADYTWYMRFDLDIHGSGHFLSLIRESLAELAKTAPNTALQWVEMIEPLTHPAALYICLETIATSGGVFGFKLPKLMMADKLLDSGPNGADWLSFARAANAALPYLSGPERSLVENRILGHWPELRLSKKIAHDLANGRPEEEPFWTRKSAIRDLNWNGYDQWCILKSIDATNLSPHALKRLSHLDRKFREKIIPKPNNMEATWVPPPIGANRAKFMSDAAWLTAVDKYREDEGTRRAGDDWLRHTGSRGLSQILQERSKEEPERFARLFSRLPTDTLPDYFNAILNGLAEGVVPEEVLGAVIRNAHALPGRPCCEGICRLLQRHPAVAADDEMFSILIWYVENGRSATDDESDQGRTRELTITAENLISMGGFVQMRSGYFDRGTAVEALGAVLWEYNARLEAGIQVLTRRIELEPLESILCLLTEPIYSVLRHDNHQAAVLLKKLVVGPDRINYLPLATHKGTLLLYYILHGSPDIGFELLELLLCAKEEEYRLLGAFHLFREAYYDDELATRAQKLAKESDQHRKLAANAAANHLPDAAYQLMAEQQLTAFFGDPVKGIRKEAAECFRGVWNKPLEPLRPLIHAFVQSKAFEEDNFSFFHLLKDAHEPTTQEVILAAERVLDLAEQPEDDSSPSGRRREMHYLDDLLLKEYSATEDCPELRTRILGILDRMLILGLYGTDKIIQEHERI
ncbi:ATP-binding protein [Geotalea sp. SG265]|uniref:AAA family ATPase n=1 Tax=Geotalea sp. SG265 TaxID=2922867 RepID=UPI001FAEC3DF|nr:ATP-binding protein [Geotalea sp. SG265]